MSFFFSLNYYFEQTTVNPPIYRVIYDFIPDFGDIYQYILNVAKTYKLPIMLAKPFVNLLNADVANVGSIFYWGGLTGGQINNKKLSLK